MNQSQTAREQAERILRRLPPRICDVLDPWVEKTPDSRALVETSGSWTYRELSTAIVAATNWLHEIGIRRGDRVIILCENCRAFVALFLASAKMGAWPVPVNARLSAREVDEIQAHSGARQTIYMTSVSPQARAHAKRQGASTVDVPYLGPISVGPLNESAVAEPSEPEERKQVAVVIYTSGTTGTPKGVMLTNENLLYIAAVSSEIRSISPKDRIYGVLPMSHIVGLSVVLLGTLLCGATLYLSPLFDPVAALSSLEKNQITIMLGSPAMFSLLVEYARVKNIPALKFPALRIISSSGAPLHARVKSETESLLGLVLHNGYGVTETSPNISQTRVEEPRQDTSVGKVIPGLEIRLVGANGQPVQEGEAGELWVRGPSVMKGYYRAPEATAEVLDKEGWFNTKDLARIEDGSLFIAGRTKDLIVRYGFNVYPAEVELVLNTCPGVLRSAVIGRSVNGDEEVVAVVQTVEGVKLTQADIMAHAARQLAPYKQPTQVYFVPSMPLTVTGKVVKGELAKMVFAGS